ncbi:hypothetical protein LCGC14_2074130, partial [marine sediment metagenome]
MAENGELDSGTDAAPPEAPAPDGPDDN